VKRFLLYLSILFSAGCFTGCITHAPAESTASPAARGRVQFADMQAAVIESTQGIEASLTYVEIQAAASASSATSFSFAGGTMNGGNNRKKSYAGLILDTKGHILVSIALKADAVERVTVWIHDEEYPAHLVKTEEALGLSLLKVDTDQVLQPIAFDRLGTLAPGAWGVILTPSGADRDFARSRDLGFCSGVEESQFTTYLLNGSRLMTGAPVMNLDGQLVGVAVGSNKALAMTDLADELQAILARVADEQSDDPSETEENDRGWLGILHAPVNQDYARKYNLPRGGILINKVIDGSPAAKAGIEAGDLIVQINGKDVRFSGRQAADYFMKVLRSREGKPFELTLARNQQRLVVSGIFGKAPEPDTLRVKALGVDVRNIDPSLVVGDTLFTDQGVYVNEIEKGSPAAMGTGGTLLSKGDVITAVAGVATPDLAAFSAAMEKLQATQPAVVLVAYMRGRVSGFAALNLSLGEKE
jgi:serine protease Do